MRTGAIIQARMTSSRLPGKVLKDLPYGSGITALEQIVKRLQAVESIDIVIIATSTGIEDKPIIDLANKKEIPVFAGSLDNVLERFYLTAEEHQLTDIVRITGDCPCLDFSVVNNAIKTHQKEKADFTSLGAIKRTFPVGMDAAIISFPALKEAYENASQNFEKEHVTPYFFKTRPERFKIVSIEATAEFNDPTLRITLDTVEDYLLISNLYDYLYKDNPVFGLKEIFSLLEKKPWLRQINRNSLHKKVHSDLASELSEVITYCETQELNKAKKYIIDNISNNEIIKVSFFVNANSRIGGGHLSRCMLVAKELNKRGVETCFLFSDTDEASIKIVSKKHKTVKLNNEAVINPSTLIEQIIPGRSLLIFDTDLPEFYEKDYQQAFVKAGIRFMYITIREDYYYSDIVLNQNIIALEQKIITETKTKKLLGPDYFIIDEVFRTSIKNTGRSKKPPFNLFVCFGGADPENLTGKTIEIIRQCSDLFNEVDIVIGGFNQNFKNIKTSLEESPESKITLHHNINYIDKLMQKADLAITSSGLTFWELTILGVPAFTIASSEREKAITDFLHKKKYTYKLGSYDNLPELARLSSIIREVCQDLDKKILFEELRKKINPKGVEKVVDEILGLFITFA